MRGWGAKQKFLTMLISVISYIHFQDRFLIYIDIDSFNVMVKLVGGGGGGRRPVTKYSYYRALGRGTRYTGVDTGELTAVVTQLVANKLSCHEIIIYPPVN